MAYFGNAMDYKTQEYIENKIQSYLASQEKIKFDLYNREPRVIGDFIERLIRDNFGELFFDIIKIYKSDFTRKSMEDIAYYDKNNNYYAIDIKTHRINDSTFNMPNLISIKSLDKFYKESDNNYFMVLRIDYKTEETKIKINNVSFHPIEFYDWKCLRIGALGWGQIQIADSSKIHTKQVDRKDWMVKLCESSISHYDKELDKIKNDRITYFSKSLEYWKKR
jgi:hypothetical protein